MSIGCFFDDPSEWFYDPESIWLLLLFSFGLALLEYFLLLRIENWIAILLGANSFFIELRWIYYLIAIVEATILLTVGLLIGLLSLIGVTLPSSLTWGLIILALLLPGLWSSIVLLYSVSQVYKFSIARTLFLNALYSFLTIVPAFVLLFMIVLLGVPC